LGQLLDEKRKALHAVILDAVYALSATDFELLQFLGNYIAQVSLLGIQILWTKESELAISQAKRDKKAMRHANEKFQFLLNTLISQTAKNLSKYERIKFESLITIHVHQRDIFEDLSKSNVKSLNDFEWLKQSRFYFIFEEDHCVCKITNINFIYQNEFLGGKVQ